MRIHKSLLLFAVVLVLVLAACGSDDNDGADDGPTTTAASSVSTPSTDPDRGTDDPTVGEVPDPCSLLSSAELTEALGSDPGTGTPNATDPSQRKICQFGNGTILAVEIARNYDASVQGIRDADGSTITEVTGTGNAAIWQEFAGGAGQFVAQGDDYFVGVTLPSGGQATGKEVAAAMLAKL